MFKYEGDRIERLGPMWEVRDWMKSLMTKEDWDECMYAIENRNKAETIEKRRRQIDYREARKAREGIREVDVRRTLAADTYELVVD